MKPASQLEQASLNEQPRNRALRMLVDRFLCINVNDERALIGPCDLMLMPDQRPMACPVLYYSTISNWSLATYPFFYSSKLFINTADFTIKDTHRTVQDDGDKLYVFFMESTQK